MKSVAERVKRKRRIDYTLFGVISKDEMSPGFLVSIANLSYQCHFTVLSELRHNGLNGWLLP
jgi:hypothetical protein